VTLQAVVAALQQVSRPFLEREVLAIVRSNQPLVVDIDLTGRRVSPTSCGRRLRLDEQRRRQGLSSCDQ
jgi:hypothetical protein